MKDRKAMVDDFVLFLVKIISAALAIYGIYYIIGTIMKL